MADPIFISLSLFLLVNKRVTHIAARSCICRSREHVGTLLDPEGLDLRDTQFHRTFDLSDWLKRINLDYHGHSFFPARRHPVSSTLLLILFSVMRAIYPRHHVLFPPLPSPFPPSHQRQTYR